MTITEEKRLFPAQEESELVLDIIRKHWFSYLIFWFLAIILSIPLLIGLYFWLWNWSVISPVWGNLIILFVSMYILSIFAILIYGFVDFYLDVYIITDRRIVDIAQNGLFKRTISELSLRQIQDVNAAVNGFAPTLLHFGDIHIQTAGETPNFVFQSIPHPYEISKKILDLHEAYMQQIEKRVQNEQHKQPQKVEKKPAKEKKKAEKADSPDLMLETLKRTITEKWFEEGAETCYSDETCRQKILDGVNKHIKEDPSVFVVKSISHDQEGELKEGKSVDL